MRAIYTRLGVYVLPLAVGLALTGCEAIEVGAPPPPTLSVAYVYPSPGPTYFATQNALYTAEAVASQDYISAQGSVDNPRNVQVGFELNTRMNTGELYKPSMPMRVPFTVFDTGTYTSNFSFFDASGPASRRTEFIVSTARPRSAPEGSSPTTSKCYNNDCGTPTPVPGPLPTITYLRYLPLPHKSAQPFLNFTNESDGRISRSDLERRAATWPQSTRDKLSAFFSVVYEDELSDFLSNVPDYPASADPADRLRAAAVTLDSREPSASGTRWVDMVEPFIARLTASPETGATTADKGSVVHDARAAMQAVTIRASPNPATTVLTVQATGAETASVFDMLGRRVARLSLPGGIADWNLRDDAGRRVPAGVYVIQIVGPDNRVSRRVTIL